MRASIPLIAVLALTSSAAAQVAQTWTLTVDQSPILDQAAASIVDAHGTTTFAGRIATTPATDGPRGAGVVARVGPQGTLAWYRTHVAQLDWRTEFVDLCEAPAGGVYAVGTAYSPQNPHFGDLVLVRYAADGSLVWSLRYGGDRVEEGLRVTTDAAGDVWVAGVAPGQNLTVTDMLVMRVSKAGAILFANTWDGPSTASDVPAEIVPDGQGGAYVTGQTAIGAMGGAQLVLLRYDSTVSLLWWQTLSSPNGEQTFGRDLAVDASGSVYVAGRLAPANFLGRPLLAKYDSIGTLLWMRSPSNNGHTTGYGQCVEIDPRGDVVFAGAWGLGNGLRDVLVQKYDTAGNVVWSRNWYGPSTDDHPHALALDAAGEIAIAGTTTQPSQDWPYDALALRLDRDGRVLWSRSFAATSPLDPGRGIGFGPLGSLFLVANVVQADPNVLVVRFDEPSVPFCFGDGSGTACPCGNATPASERAGCASSLGHGGRLTADGVSSLANDTLTLRGSGMPDASALYFQGTTQVGAGAGAAFGDGLRCAGGSIVRLKTVMNAAGASQFPAAGDPSVSAHGQIGAPGTRTYQVWYRNAVPFCTSSPFNLTNGVLVIWTS